MQHEGGFDNENLKENNKTQDPKPGPTSTAFL